MVNRRKIAFVLASSDHGALIVNRFDYRMIDEKSGYGVGFDLLNTSSFASEEIDLGASILQLRREYFGDGVVAVDCGANIGVHTVDWAKRLNGWGSVIAIEAQERIYYALAGNIAINNCFNARAMLAAVGAGVGTIRVPQPDYSSPGSFGSLELIEKASNENIGQRIDYRGNTAVVQVVTLDSLNLERVDFVKIDVEGMELDVLQGAEALLKRQIPVLLIESIKTDAGALRSRLAALGYRLFSAGINILAVHENDKTLAHINPAQE